MSDNLPKLSYTARDYTTIQAQLVSLVKQTRPDLWTDFSDTDLGETLLTLVSAIGDILSYGQDQVAQEIFLATCQNYESGLRFAKSVGYVPKSALAASASMKSVGSLPANLISLGGTIPALTQIKGINGLIYEIDTAYTVNVGDTVIKLTVVNGQTITEEFSPSAQQNQTITMSRGVVQDASWRVYVGDITNPANLWTQVDDTSFETSATQTYSVSLDSQGRLSVTFGDGTAGAIPNNTITVVYRICDGAAGNAPVGAITGSVKVSLTGGGTVAVQLLNEDDSAQITGGTQLHTAENQGLTVAASTQSGTLSAAPVVSGTLVLSIVLPGLGGSMVLQDSGAGTFTVITNTTGLTLSTSAITYSTGAWSIHTSASMPSGGAITATYYAIVAASVQSAASIGAATGGQDRETLTQLKRNIPAYIRSQNKILTVQDYNDNLLQLPGITLSFVTPLVSSYTANLIKVNVWGSEIYGFQSEDSLGNFGPTVPYTRYTQVGDDQVSNIQSYLAARTLLTVSNVVLRPTMLWADVYLGAVSYDKRVDPTLVRTALTANVIAAFQNATGFVVRASDLSDAISTSTGVKYFNIQRVATGAQQVSAELQGVTSVSTTVSGTLAFPTASPKSVKISINQTSTLTIVLVDDGAGHLVLDSGTVTLSSGTIDYATGAWTATFSAALIGSQTVAASYANVQNDYRAQQVVVIGVTGGDNWPPPGITESSPVVTPPFKDGKPLSALRSGSSVTYPYAIGDVLTYDVVGDIVVNTDQSNQHRFNEEFIYNNEIFYDSVDNLSSGILAINLRRLVFDLVPV